MEIFFIAKVFIFLDNIPYGGILYITGDKMDNNMNDKVNDNMNDNCISQCNCSHKTKQRSDEEYKKLINRLNRIEGQIRGIKGMVEKNAYCTDILIQVSAVNCALNAFNKELLANHIKTCVAEDIRRGKDETIDELVVTLQKLMK